MVAVGRHINGITINPLEYIINEDGDVMTWNDEGEAMLWLVEHGATEDDMYWFVFKDVEELHD